MLTYNQRKSADPFYDFRGVPMADLKQTFVWKNILILAKQKSIADTFRVVAKEECGAKSALFAKSSEVIEYLATEPLSASSSTGVSEPPKPLTCSKKCSHLLRELLNLSYFIRLRMTLGSGEPRLSME